MILLNQFHDIIPGTCIEKVYDTTDEEYARILADGHKEAKKAVNVIAKYASAKEKEDTIVVVNTTGYEREDIVTLSDQLPGITAVRSGDGKLRPIQHTEKGLVFFGEKIPAAGYKKFYPVYEEAPKAREELHKGKKEENAWDGTYENRFYKVRFNEQMQMVSLIEKSDGREYIREGMAGNVLCTYEDRPMNWDNWDIDEYYKRKPYEADWVSAPVIRENGPVETVVEYSLGFGNSTVTQKVYFYQDLPRIDFAATAQWNTHHVLLRINFPVEVNASIKSGTYPNENADIGCHEFTYSVYPHHGGWREARTVEMAYDLNVPLFAALCRKGGKTAREGASESLDGWNKVSCMEGAGKVLPESFVSCDRKECFLETVKRSEDGKDWILRMYEHHNSHVKAKIRLGISVKQVMECDLLEQPAEELEIKNGEFTAAFKPYEIKTFRLVISNTIRVVVG